jgi:hypothetical protein
MEKPEQITEIMIALRQVMTDFMDEDKLEVYNLLYTAYYNLHLSRRACRKIHKG